MNDSQTKHKVLIVEDESCYQKDYRDALGSAVQILAALDIKTARELFSQNPDIAIIVMDACVPGVCWPHDLRQ